MNNVASVEVDFQQKTATVTCKQGNSVSREAVEAALKKAGNYGVTDFKELSSAPGTGA
ncbi:MAG: hypothetical protein HY699_00985 [Deltaproteobacteria bacterium]|nr:hypothetical protein [Deltaproteobacteria bacterium]